MLLSCFAKVAVGSQKMHFLTFQRFCGDKKVIMILLRQALSTQLLWATRMSMKLFLSSKKRNKDTIKLGFELFSINSAEAGRKGYRDQDILEPILVKAPHVICDSNKYLVTLGNATVVMGTLRVTVLSGEINPIVYKVKNDLEAQVTYLIIDTLSKMSLNRFSLEY